MTYMYIIKHFTHHEKSLDVLTDSTKQSLNNLATHMSEMSFWDAQPKGYKSRVLRKPLPLIYPTLENPYPKS